MLTDMRVMRVEIILSGVPRSADKFTLVGINSPAPVTCADVAEVGNPSNK